LPVVTRDHFSRIVERNYVKAREKLFEQARGVLAHEKIKKSIEGYLNQVLSREMARAIQLALGTGQKTVEVQLNLAKIGQRLHGGYPTNLKTQLPAELVVLAIELLLHEAKYEVNLLNHTCTWKKDMPDLQAADPASPSAAEVAPAEAEPPAKSLEEALANTPQLSIAPDDGEGGGGDLDIDDDMSGLDT